MTGSRSNTSNTRLAATTAPASATPELLSLFSGSYNWLMK